MTTSSSGAIVPITLTVNGRTGLTLWAPPWEDNEGEEWQGFLGDGAKILLYPSTRELAEFIASGEENDLSDHPAWGRVSQLSPDQLRPDSEESYDLDQVYEWASGEPDPVHVSGLADVVDMVTKIAESCDDGALRRLVQNTPAYEELVDEDVSYQGKDGRKRWDELGDTISETWERAISRVEAWLSWQGDFSASELDTGTIWDRVGATPIEVRFADTSYLTVRGEISEGTSGEETRVVFCGSDDTVAVFNDVAGLARYCRVAEEHELRKLPAWDQLVEITDDGTFAPGPDDRYDLRKPSARGAALLRELSTFCNLDADLSVLDGPSVDRDDWRDLLGQVRTCIQLQD